MDRSARLLTVPSTSHAACVSGLTSITMWSALLPVVASEGLELAGTGALAPQSPALQRHGAVD